MTDLRTPAEPGEGARRDEGAPSSWPPPSPPFDSIETVLVANGMTPVVADGWEKLPADPSDPVPPSKRSGPARGRLHGRRIAPRPSLSDSVFRSVSFSAGGITVGIMLCVGFFLTINAGKAIGVAGPSFLIEQQWSPETGTFGIAAVLFGTVSIALIAMTVSVPLALGTSLLISEVLRGRLQRTVISLVDLMAAVPSVVFGLWGLFFLQENIIPVSQWISTYFGWIPIFAVTDQTGQRLTEASAVTSSAFIAGIVVALMVVPTQTSVMREAFSQAPLGEREGALALGSTRWGMIRAVVLPFGKGGVIGGTMLGLGRALGETIAVYMIISPIFSINWEVLKTGTNSVSALIALRYGEANELGLSALMAAGLVLFLLTLVVNFTASNVVARSRSGASSQ
ncbi:phosphate ABC transporter permease subunit PstC [Cnuibacter sp. UC19_7]|uniref:phosphate ABC transporter permease subunit PstC n=1 Tax=Cnuibacter sp. UC19_7 TaxID=3350166 RepID=UPI003671DD5C